MRITDLLMMRFATAVEPGGDWGDDDATLIYDLPEIELEEEPVFVSASATEPPARTRARAQHVSGGQVTTTVIAALIGAMAGAWSIEQRDLDLAAVPSVQALASVLGALWPADRAARIAAAPRRASVPVPARPVQEASAMPSAPVPGAPVEAPAAAQVATETETATAAETETEPERDRPRQRTEARARASRSARSRPAALRTEREPAAVDAAAARAASAAPAAKAAPGSRAGLLRINSRPWSKIYVDGRPIGSTPQTAIELSPGRHRIALISEEFALKRTLTVKVRAGETVTRSVELLQ